MSNIDALADLREAVAEHLARGGDPGRLPDAKAFLEAEGFDGTVSVSVHAAEVESANAPPEGIVGCPPGYQAEKVLREIDGKWYWIWTCEP